HVRLVERIDLEIRAGDGHCELPAEELPAERVRVCDLGLRLLTVRAVRRLARRRDQPLAELAGRLRDQLLGPEAEAAVGLLDADLVASLLPAGPEPATELVAGIAVPAPADLRHAIRIREQPRDVDAHQRRGDDPERRQRGVAAADRRLAGKHVTKAALLCEALEL